MIKFNKQPVHSDYRYQQNQSIQWFQPYHLAEHVTTASQQHFEKKFAIHPNRPHLNITLDNQYKVKALVDSGSSICLGDSSLIRHLKHKFQ